MIIAVDGPAAAGKGVLTRRLADHFGLAQLDTGMIYRAAGAKVLRQGGDPADAEAATQAARDLDAADFEDPELRTEEVARAASKVAALPEVRAVLLDYQRNFAKSPPGGEKGAVIDGRDIGTVVCPDTPYKIFLTASPEVRARRRYKELREKGVAAIYSRVLRDMENRDQQDRSRDLSPLVPARDALELNTDDLDPDAVFTAALEYINSRNQSG